jgi:hypothetical protein
VAKNDQQEQLDKIVSTNLARAIDFVKFAETKNAALLTFCSAWLIALATLIISDKPVPQSMVQGAKLALPFFVLGAGICLISFFPIVSSQLLKDVYAGENLLFFGDVAKIPLANLISNSTAKYLPKEGETTTDGYLADMFSQISANSRIASRKFKLFGCGAGCVLLGLFFLVAPTIGRIL